MGHSIPIIKTELVRAIIKIFTNFIFKLKNPNRSINKNSTLRINVDIVGVHAVFTSIVQKKPAHILRDQAFFANNSYPWAFFHMLKSYFPEPHHFVMKFEVLDHRS